MWNSAEEIENAKTAEKNAKNVVENGLRYTACREDAFPIKEKMIACPKWTKYSKVKKL